MQLNDITHQILDSAYKVHSNLGPGLLESTYQACLVYELRKKGLTVEVEWRYEVGVWIQNWYIGGKQSGGGVEMCGGF